MSTRPANKLCSSEVDRWLQRLKLSQYAPNFHQNKLTNLKQCQRLTRQTLELMGVTLPGHITRLERAILKLRSDRSSNRMSNSLEDLHAELERDSVTASSSFYYRFGEVIDMTSLPRSESDPELCGPTALHEDFSPNSSDYYDMLSEFISPVNITFKQTVTMNSLTLPLLLLLSRPSNPPVRRQSWTPSPTNP